MTEQISKNFKMSEFEYSATAQAHKINNTIPDKVKPAVRSLVNNLLQPICNATGWNDFISSGYRSKALNEHPRIKGASNSQHRTGEAADNKFYTKQNGKTVYVKPIDVLRKVKELGLDFDQMIAYNTFVHLSYTTTRANRKQVLYDKNYTGSRL